MMTPDGKPTIDVALIATGDDVILLPSGERTTAAEITDEQVSALLTAMGWRVEWEPR